MTNTSFSNLTKYRILEKKGEKSLGPFYLIIVLGKYIHGMKEKLFILVAFL